MNIDELEPPELIEKTMQLINKEKKVKCAYLSDLTWQQRQKFGEDLNHWLVQWLNENAPRLGDGTS